MSGPLKVADQIQACTLFMIKASHLVRSSLLITFFLGIDKIAGFVKLLLITRYFGTGADADAYAAAAQLPELLQAMLLGGALAAALVPVYSAYVSKSEHENAEALARTVLTLTMIISAVVCSVTAYFSPWLVEQFLVPDFPPAQQQQTAQLMRIFMLAMGLLSIASVTSALLNARHHYLTPALGALLTDLGQIAGLYLLVPTQGIYGLAWGNIFGILLLISVQLIPYLRLGIGIMPQLALRLAGLRETLYLLWPRIVTMGVYQASDLFFIRLASRLPEGVISAYFYALLVMVTMPRSLFQSGIATVLFPTLSDLYNQKQTDKFKMMLSYGIQAVLAMLIPSIIGLIALGPSAFAFLFQRGEFGAESTALVYSLALILSLRLICEAVAELLFLPFFAHHDTKVPMFTSVGWMVISVALYYVLVGPLGIHGLALATAIAAIALVVAMLWLNRRILGKLDEAYLLNGLARILLAAGAMAAVIFGLRNVLNSQSALPLAITIALGAMSYISIYLLFGFHEVRSLIQFTLGRGTEE